MTKSGDGERELGTTSTSAPTNKPIAFIQQEDAKELSEQISGLLRTIMRISRKMTPEDHPAYNTQMFLNVNTTTLQVAKIIIERALGVQALAVVDAEKRRSEDEKLV